MKYIVIWCILNWVPDPCPIKSIPDEFGRINYSMNCAVLHGHFEQGKPRTKEFSTMDSAQAFYERAIMQTTGIIGGRVGCLEIDSIATEDK